MWDLVKGRSTFSTKLEAEAEEVHFSPSGATYALLCGSRVTLHAIGAGQGECRRSTASSLQLGLTVLQLALCRHHSFCCPKLGNAIKAHAGASSGSCGWLLERMQGVVQAQVQSVPAAPQTGCGKSAPGALHHLVVLWGVIWGMREQQVLTRTPAECPACPQGWWGSCRTPDGRCAWPTLLMATSCSPGPRTAACGCGAPRWARGRWCCRNFGGWWVGRWVAGLATVWGWRSWVVWGGDEGAGARKSCRHYPATCCGDCRLPY